MKQGVANHPPFRAGVRSMAICSANGATVDEVVGAMKERHSDLRPIEWNEFIKGDFRAGEVKMPSEPQRPLRLLEAALLPALSRAGLSAAELQKTGIFVGTTGGFFAQSEMLVFARDSAVSLATCREHLISRGVGEVAATAAQISGASGPQLTYSIACTSSAFAQLEAWRFLRAGVIDHAIVIGFETLLNVTAFGFKSLMLYSDDVYRPFDLRRNGLNLGEGCAVMVFDRGRTPGQRFSLLGGAARNDHFNITGTDPNSNYVSDLLEGVLSTSGKTVSDLLAIKAHGTGTTDNDLAEGSGYRRYFARVPPIASLKAYMGHTLGAAGAIESVMWLAALEAGFIPASHGFAEVDAAIGIAPLTTAVKSQPGCYAMTHFGFGGSSVGMMFEMHGALDG